MRQDLYNKLWDNGMRNLELPVQNMKLVSAFNNRARKVKTEATLILKFGEVKGDQISHSPSHDDSSLNWCRLLCHQ